MEKEFTQTQRDTLEKINNLLENSASSLLCGPDCQHNNYVKEMKQKYEEAQTMETLAPHQVEEAKKNYLIASEGEYVYNRNMEEDMKKNAKKITEHLSENFDKKVENIRELNGRYRTEIVSSNNTQELSDFYEQKNEHLTVVFDTTSGAVTTNERKAFYELNDLSVLHKRYNWLLFLYYLAVIGLSIWIFRTQSKQYWVKNLLVILACIVYPFAIDFLRHFILFLLTLILPRGWINEKISRWYH